MNPHENQTGEASSTPQNSGERTWVAIKWLACMLFFTFAMTTDAVGVIIPEVIKEFKISLTEAGAFHYTTMIAIALSGIGLGHLPDKIGHKNALVIGLLTYGVSCLLFMVGDSFYAFLCLLFMGGLAIGVFKTSALALVGDITRNSEEHTRTMNVLEGFFALGAIVGPFLVSTLLEIDFPWQYLYLIAACICGVLFIAALKVEYPTKEKAMEESPGLLRTLAMLKDPYALFFGVIVALYVSTEVAIYVWMPTLLGGYAGNSMLMATYALTIFFVLRAVGRFLGWWILSKFSWTAVMVYFTLAIFACYLLTILFGVEAAVFLLPLSGLFMSMIYPTINSKAISCFPKANHGSVAGLILFFTAVAAALAPLLMGQIGDLFGHIKYGFVLATIFSGLLFLAMVYNHLYQPAATRLSQLD